MAARFQPYSLSILDSRSAGGFATRQLITFPTWGHKVRFLRYIRYRCQARRRGDWAIIPGHALILRAISYAARHWSYTYNLPLVRAPCYIAGQAADDMDSDPEEKVQPEEEQVNDEELDEGAH
jgi:hypothetical protein